MRRAATDFDALTNDEKMVACAWFFGTMNLGQEVEFLRQSGTIEDEYAENIQGAIAAFVQMQGVSRWWEEFGSLFGTTFRARVGGLLASPSCPPPFSEVVPAFLEGGSAKGRCS